MAAGLLLASGAALASRTARRLLVRGGQSRPPRLVEQRVSSGWEWLSSEGRTSGNQGVGGTSMQLSAQPLAIRGVGCSGTLSAQSLEPRHAPYTAPPRPAPPQPPPPCLLPLRAPPCLQRVRAGGSGHPPAAAGDDYSARADHGVASLHFFAHFLLIFYSFFTHFLLIFYSLQQLFTRASLYPVACLEYFRGGSASSSLTPAPAAPDTQQYQCSNQPKQRGKPRRH